MTIERTDAGEAPYYHTVGIGAGPANLSLAALYQSAPGHSIALFDKGHGPTWHADLLHSGVRMQTSWLKDLVSLVDPTHKLTFLNYLVSTGRLFALLNAQFDFIPRREYMNYLAWAENRSTTSTMASPSIASRWVTRGSLCSPKANRSPAASTWSSVWVHDRSCPRVCPGYPPSAR